MISLVLSSYLALACAEPPPEDPKAAAPSAAEVVAAIETVIADAIERAEPSVVAIHRHKRQNSQETTAVRGRRPAVNSRDRQQRLGFDGGRTFRFTEPPNPNMISFDFGAGVVIGDRGQIVTLYHVVKGAEELIVRAADRQQFNAEIIAADPRSDLAVIAPVEGDPADFPKLKPIVIGDAGKLRKGSFLIALGNPFNAARDGKPSASWGILANFARKLDIDLDDFAPARQPTLRDHPTLLQLDSKLNLGMSGGAVINLKGELVGLTTSAASPAGFDAMAGYAVPMDKLGRRALETLKEGKEIEYGMLGIRPEMHTNRVREVNLNSPAAQGDVLVNDEIIAVNDVPVFDFDSLILAVNVYSAGDAVRLKIRRGPQTVDRTIILAKYPVEGEVIVTNRPEPWRGLRVDYASTISFRGFGRDLPETPAPGVVVTDVDEGSAAAAAGIKKGQIIHKVQNQILRSPRDFSAAVTKLEGPVTLETNLGPVTVK